MSRDPNYSYRLYGSRKYFTDHRNTPYWRNDDRFNHSSFNPSVHSHQNLRRAEQKPYSVPRLVERNVKVEPQPVNSRRNDTQDNRERYADPRPVQRNVKVEPRPVSSYRDRPRDNQERCADRQPVRDVKIKPEANDVIDTSLKRRSNSVVSNDTVKKIRVGSKVKLKPSDKSEATTERECGVAIKKESDQTRIKMEPNYATSVKSEEDTTEMKLECRAPCSTKINVKRESDENRNITAIKSEKSQVKEETNCNDVENSKVNNTTKNSRSIRNKPVMMKTQAEKTDGSAKDETRTVVLPKKGNQPESAPSQRMRKRCQMEDDDWEAEMLTRMSDIPFRVAKNVINMLKSDCTIPFIARYRTDRTDCMSADKLRLVKDNYEYIKTLKTKAEKRMNLLAKNGKLTDELKENIRNVQTLDDLEFIYAPYKQAGGNRSKAEKARALGLEEISMAILEGTSIVYLENYLDDRDGLKTVNEIAQGVQHIIADVFSKNPNVLDYLHDLERTARITINSKRACNTTKKADADANTKNNDSKDALGKFEIYYDFQSTTKHIQPHQILALNRGESLKILSVKVAVDDLLSKKLYEFCENKWLKQGYSYPLRTKIFNNSFTDSYARLISPFIARRARSELNRKAQFAAVENFAANLKNLLQTPPVKGCSILGIDPGFRHGFKFALINHRGDVQWTEILNIDTTCPGSLTNKRHLKIIKEMMVLHKCELVAIGNGKGCRVIEEILTHYINNRFFSPEINLKYTIVNERGASIYSCSTDEFPTLDPKLISAVFIARSLQEPLNEYVKVEPQHLGVGMYQHDIPETQLSSTLDEIVSECVSFTGVDINTASIHLLKRVSGLGARRAANVIEWRRKNGPFTNREQLTMVKMIGEKTYEQCCGFVRVLPETAFEEGKEADRSKYSKAGVNSNFNPLDTTWIHPESYLAAYSIIDKCGANLEELGTESFINKIKMKMNKQITQQLASQLNITEETLSFLLDALMKPKDYDYRSQFAKPMFKQGLNSISNLKIGMNLTGVVGNVADFGAFVDIGVGMDGLIHRSNMNGYRIQVGDRVDVRVKSLEIERGRISLFLTKIIK